MLKTPRAAILLVFAAFGSIVGGHVGALPVIIRNAALTDYFFGMAQSFAMAASIAAMLLAGFISRKFDHRIVILLSMPICLAAMLYALTVQSPSSYFISVLLLASVLSVLDLNMNAEGAVIEVEVQKPIFTMYHASVSFGMAVSCILSSILSVMVSPAAVAGVAALMVIWAAFEVDRLVPHRKPHAEADRHGFKSLPHKSLIWVGLTIGFSNACEIAAIMWAGQLLAGLRPELIAYSGLGMAFFGLCGGTMRLFGDRLRTHFGEINAMLGSLFVATIGMVVLSLNLGFAISVVAFAAVGGGLAFIFPGLFSLAGHLAPKQRAAAMGFASAVSGGPRFVIPWLLGVLASWYSITTVFAATAVFAIISMALVYFALSPLAQKKAPK